MDYPREWANAMPSMRFFWRAGSGTAVASCSCIRGARRVHVRGVHQEGMCLISEKIARSSGCQRWRHHLCHEKMSDLGNMLLCIKFCHITILNIVCSQCHRYEIILLCNILILMSITSLRWCVCKYPGPTQMYSQINFVMNCLNVYSQGTALVGWIVTVGTPLILDFVMNCLDMCSQGTALAKYFVTVLTSLVLDFVMVIQHASGTESRITLLAYVNLNFGVSWFHVNSYRRK